jgi:hypothetical protein
MKSKTFKKLVKLCHVCNQVTECERELERCPKCNKSFLPLNYFEKIHGQEKQHFKDLFTDSEHLYEEDLIKGIHVLW